MPTFELRLPQLFANQVIAGSGWVPVLADRWRFSTVDGQSGIGQSKQGNLIFIFTTASQLVTSDHGTVTVGTAPAGFKPTTDLVGKIQWSGTAPAIQTAVERQFSSGPATNLLDSTFDFLFADMTPFADLWGGFTNAELGATGDGFFYEWSLDLDDIFVTGNYEIFQFTYTMDPASGSEVNANTPNSNDGDLITITSNGLDPDHLLLDELTLSVACGTVQIVTQTETLLQFRIPASCGVAGGNTAITATGNGTQFSGSVTLGTLVVLATNGSGVYVLTPGATHDTLYSSLRDGTTRNVKIPNPTFRSGFIGG